MTKLKVTIEPIYHNGRLCLKLVDIDMHIGSIEPKQALQRLEELSCQVKETLEALEAKQKTWEAREESQEDQLEQEHSIPNNDPKLPEKEQSQRTRNPNKQYIISYPHGATICKVTGHSLDNSELSERLLAGLRAGKDITMPDTWKVQVVDL